MTTLIALLRGINVVGNNELKRSASHFSHSIERLLSSQY